MRKSCLSCKKMVNENGMFYEFEKRFICDKKPLVIQNKQGKQKVKEKMICEYYKKQG